VKDLQAGLEVTPMVHLLRPLGEGGMGTVWVARHKGLETDVVVKFLGDVDHAERKDAEARFAREAAAAAAVKSPHVVQVFDHGTTADGTRYIVMELLEGRDLRTHLATQGPMAPRDVAAVVSQVAKALSKAHQVGVIHRDIKPDNIFLCDGEGGEMFVKVLDFGVAKREAVAGTKTTTGAVVGTPYYMSPEQILGEGPIDARSDIWSLGVVAFESLTGKRPYDGVTVGAVTLAIHSVQPVPSAVLPTLPPAVDEWFRRACARHADSVSPARARPLKRCSPRSTGSSRRPSRCSDRRRCRSPTSAIRLS
jgi:serine/threonine-protein kinase